MSQSTNDVYPTALKLAAYSGIMGLVDAMAVLRQAFEAKSEEFKDIIKMGRTQLQDAVPMTLGQEFSTYAVMLGEDEQRLKEAVLLICEINMGATAIGTGINCPSGLCPRGLRTFAGDDGHSSCREKLRPRQIAAKMRAVERYNWWLVSMFLSEENLENIDEHRFADPSWSFNQGWLTVGGFIMPHEIQDGQIQTRWDHVVFIKLVRCRFFIALRCCGHSKHLQSDGLRR